MAGLTGVNEQGQSEKQISMMQQKSLQTIYTEITMSPGEIFLHLIKKT